MRVTITLFIFLFFLGSTKAQNKDFIISSAEVAYISDFDQYIFEIKVKGKAGNTVPEPKGQLDGAPIEGYVFPTTLKPTSVGFGDVEGILALALTSHPDFDDTPLWDENKDGKYENDGNFWHSHWVVLVKDERVEGRLSVKELKKGDNTVDLPPTNPGMPMFMDSPGYPVITRGASIKVIVPG